MSVHRAIQRVIYQLKRERGTPIKIKREKVETNVTTGCATSITVMQCSISRAIILHATISTDFVYDLSFIAANKNFTYGGLFDTNNRNILIDARDVRDDLSEPFTIHQNDNVYIGNRVYTIQSLKKYDRYGMQTEDDPRVLAYLLTVQDLEAAKDVQ